MNRLVLAIYRLVLLALVPAALLHLWWRGRRQPAYRLHIAERFGRYEGVPPQPCLWVHAVSVGETRAAQPLVKKLAERYPDHRILMTHTTPTGRETGESLFGDTVVRIYLPYDLPGAVASFMDHFRPAMGVLMETELWPNLTMAAARRGIPVFLVNARLSEKSARGYRRMARLTRMTLGHLAGIAAQTPADAQRLESLGARTVEIAGNLKFDIEPPHSAREQGQRLRDLFGTARPVFLAASTREGEEQLLLSSLSRLQPRDALFVIVPRHPQRFADVEQALRSAGLRYQRRSDERMVQPDTRVVLGDSMGELFAYYLSADIAFVGGSLLPLGGQNLIEACAVGTPVLVGPHTFNFRDATAQALATGAARLVHDADDLMETASRLLASADDRRRMSDAGKHFAQAHRGATARVMALVESRVSV